MVLTLLSPKNPFCNILLFAMLLFLLFILDSLLLLVLFLLLICLISLVVHLVVVLLYLLLLIILPSDLPLLVYLVILLVPLLVFFFFFVLVFLVLSFCCFFFFLFFLFFLFFFFFFFVFWFWFSFCFSDCLVVLALGLLVVGALFSVYHQFLVIRLVFLHFSAWKMQAQKRGLTIFRPMFSSILGVCETEGAHYLGRSRRGIWSPLVAVCLLLFCCRDRKTLEI